MAKRMKPKGVFCLETDWWGVRDSTTVEPVLGLLQSHTDYKAPYIHRDVGTLEELDYYLKKWSQRGLATYPILYLALHGDNGVVWVGDGRKPRNTLTLADIASRLEGKCAGKVIHFGSCSTLAVDGRRLSTFLRQTGATAVCGYKADVDWLMSTAFELLLFGHMQDWSFTKRGLQAVNRQIRKEASGLARSLQFRMVVKS